MPLRKAPRTRTTPATTTNTTSITNAQLQTMIDQGVAAALATRDANRSTNGEDSHNSGTGVRRTEHVSRECTYQDFMKCQPLLFKGTKGVVKLTQWFEWMKIVFRISNWSRIFEASRARGFVLRSQELQILSFIWEIQYPNLID
ncbi:hypothetical protein Tco_0758155 [Tanacetum coccineum]